mmetsp:Transcript_21489/g.52621  ORF Transcript_21489/g.52621 Transcript_21489/m.52621 type:complete len:111 (-) Transcript_21489:1060-1392(-)
MCGVSFVCVCVCVPCLYIAHHMCTDRMYAPRTPINSSIASWDMCGRTDGWTVRCGARWEPVVFPCTSMRRVVHECMPARACMRVIGSPTHDAHDGCMAGRMRALLANASF